MKVIVLRSIRDRKYRKALLQSKPLEERVEILEELLEILTMNLRETEEIVKEQRSLFRKTLRLLNMARKKTKSLAE